MKSLVVVYASLTDLCCEGEMNIGVIMYFQLPSFIKRWHWQHTEEKNTQQNENGLQPSVVVFSGAGLSAESGIATFRGKSTVWNADQNMRFLDSAIIQEDLVGFLDFHNARRREMLAVNPNAAHQALAELQQQFQVRVITQNIDDLHERAGSKNLVHLHGSILHLRPVGYEGETHRTPWIDDIQPGQTDHKTGHQLRPDIVLFGESIYGTDQAMEWLAKSDVVIVVGTSLVVEPAASLLRCTHPDAQIYYVNIEALPESRLPMPGTQLIGPATEQIPALTARLKEGFY